MMNVNRHIFFRKTDEPLLYAYVLKNNIVPIEDGEFCGFDILESDPHWENMKSLADMERRTSYSYKVFSKKELQEAPWLRVRSKWEFAYPQPERKDGYREGVFASGYCMDCSSVHQIGSFRVKKAPKWGRRNFAMLYWVGDELFVNGRVKEVFLEEGITGIDYLPLMNKRGDETLPDVHQLLFTTILENGLVINEGIKKISTCTYCGAEKYLASQRNMLTYRKEAFENAPDFAKSREVFGAGHYAAHQMFISQRVYQILSKHKLLQGLEFEAIALV